MTPELAATLTALVIAAARELLAWAERRHRRRGRLRTRADDS